MSEASWRQITADNDAALSARVGHKNTLTAFWPLQPPHPSKHPRAERREGRNDTLFFMCSKSGIGKRDFKSLEETRDIHIFLAIQNLGHG